METSCWSFQSFSVPEIKRNCLHVVHVNRALSCSSLLQVLLCEGLVQAVVGVSKSRVVTSSHSASGSTLQVFTLSDSGRYHRTGFVFILNQLFSHCTDITVSHLPLCQHTEFSASCVSWCLCRGPRLSKRTSRCSDWHRWGRMPLHLVGKIVFNSLPC